MFMSISYKCMESDVFDKKNNATTTTISAYLSKIMIHLTPRVIRLFLTCKKILKWDLQMKMN